MLQRKYIKNSVQVSKRDYLRDKEFKSDILESIQHEDGRFLKIGNQYNFEYWIKDHLGNVRVTFSDNNGNGILVGNEIRSRNDYYPFGLEWNNRWELGDTISPLNLKRYNGKELVEDMNLDLLFFGHRMLDPALCRWWTPDILSHKMPAWSSYSYGFNNPIKYIDPNGAIPYPITIRAFAPFKTFGGGFHGDNRGYSTNNVSARVHQKINFDTDNTMITTSAWSSPSWHSLAPNFVKTAIPDVNFEGDYTIKKNGNYKTFNFGTHVKGSNPLTPGAPNIDVFADFSIKEDKKAGTLNISGKLTGDNFPSTEAFISDSNGNNVFIGIGYYEGSPLNLYGEDKKNPISSFNFLITTDKDGNFTGVKQGKTNYSIKEWNKRFETADPHKNIEK